MFFHSHIVRFETHLGIDIPRKQWLNEVYFQSTVKKTKKQGLQMPSCRFGLKKNLLKRGRFPHSVLWEDIFYNVDNVFAVGKSNLNC